MYYDRIPTDEEALYISRAQQKIASLTTDLAEEYSRNDIDEYKAQLCIELQYSVEVLLSTELTWTLDEIQMMIGYYTVEGALLTFGYVGVDYCPVYGQGTPGSEVWATVPALNLVEQNSIDYDAYLLSLIQGNAADIIEGDNILQLQIDNINISGGTLTVEITAAVSVGGIYVGQVFPIGTPLQSLWIAALSLPVSVDNFTFDTYAAAYEVGAGITISQFSWDLVGAPVNMKLSDSEGSLVNQAVSGSGYTPGAPIVYPINAIGPITWTLTADNMEPVELVVDVWYLNYYGKSTPVDDVPVTVSEAMILGSTSQLANTTQNVVRTPNTTFLDQGFIAVPKVQTNGDYTKWIESGANESLISTGDFIIPPVDVAVGGVTYSVYRWGYRSPITVSLKLYR
jgi:hypothetical protein